MKEEDEFQGIGKRTPYTAPEGFFERISETTLQKAKQSEDHRRKNLVLWRTIAVAVSLTGISLFGYYSWESNKIETKIVAKQEKPGDSVQSIQQLQISAQQPIVAEIRKVEPAKTIGKEKSQENLNDVLVDLSEEELLQLVAIYKTDPFISESEE
jgi:hypothetical protein